MFDIKDLYQEIIVDHNRNPRNFGIIDNADKIIEGFNPLCGDKLKLYLKTEGKNIADISFDGSGCAISVASASLMTDAMKGKSINDAELLFNNFHELIQTLETIKKHGIENVRGSLFTSPFPLTQYEKVMAAQLYCELHGLCRKCGGKGHFITQCKDKEVEEWVQQFGGVLDFNRIDTKRVCLSCDVDITSLPKNYRYCRKCFYEKNKY